MSGKRLNEALIAEKASQLANQTQDGSWITVEQLAESLQVSLQEVEAITSQYGGITEIVQRWSIAQLSLTLRQAIVGRKGIDALLALANGYEQFATANEGAYQYLWSRNGNASKVEFGAIFRTLTIVLASCGLEAQDLKQIAGDLLVLLHGRALLKSILTPAGMSSGDNFHRQVTALIDR